MKYSSSSAIFSSSASFQVLASHFEYLLSIALATFGLIVATALAGYIPARRATRVDPMIALRYE